MVANCLYILLGIALGFIGIAIQDFLYKKDLDELGEYHIQREQRLSDIIKKREDEIKFLKRELERRNLYDRE